MPNPGAILSSLFGMASLASKADAEHNAGFSNALELERAARMADAQSVDALSRGNLLAGQQRMKGTSLMRRQKVAYANSGVTADGTPSQALDSSQFFSEYDAQNLQNNAVREAFGFKEVGRKYRAQRDETKRKMEQAQKEAQLALIGQGISLIGGLL